MDGKTGRQDATLNAPIIGQSIVNPTQLQIVYVLLDAVVLIASMYYNDMNILVYIIGVHNWTFILPAYVCHLEPEKQM